MGLHRRSSLVVGIGLVVCLGTFAILGLQAVNSATERELTSRLLLAVTIARQMDGWLEHLQGDLVRARDDSRLTADSDSESNNVRALRELRGHLDVPMQSLVLFGTAGQVIASDPADGAPPSIGDLNLEKTYRRGESSISALHLSPSGRHLLSFVTPIFDRNGLVNGALVAQFDFSTLESLGFWQPVQIGGTAEVQIIDDQGNEVGQSVDEDPPLMDRPRFSELINRGVPYVGTCHRCHDAATRTPERQDDLIAFAPLANAPLGVMVRQSADEALSTVRDLTWKTIAFGLLLLVGGLIWSRFTIRSIVNPIVTLSRAARAIAEGDLRTRVPPVGHSEIAVLAEDFDEMRSRLNQSVREIEEWNETLEHKVSLRTRELSALLQAANNLASTLDLDAVLGSIVTITAQTFESSQGGALMLYDPEEGRLSVRSSFGYEKDHLLRFRLRSGEGVPGKVFASSREQLFGDRAACEAGMSNLGEANRQALTLAGATLQPSQALICAPLIAKNNTIGCLFLSSDKVGGFNASDLGLLRAIAHQAAVAVDNGRLYEEVRRNQHVRGELLTKLVGAQEDERRRIARELHDETSQAITAVVMSLAQLRKIVPATLPKVHESITEIEQLAGQTLDDIHRLVYDLRPTVLDDLGLVPAIQWVLETHAQRAGLLVDLRVVGIDRRLPLQVETVLFRIVQEAVTNIERHAEASSAIVSLIRRDGVVAATIEDDGKGFDVAAVSNRTGLGGLGILGVTERVNLLGGKFNMVSQSGHGTTLSVELPVLLEVTDD